MILLTIKRLASKIGVDGAIGYTLIARFIQAGGSIVSLALIALFLSKEEQGFYYTFGSILAIQIFFELGFNSILTQYAAHETAHFSSYDFSTDENEVQAKSRLSSLLHFLVKWFSLIDILLFIVLMVVGSIFFKKYGYGMNVNWKIPWIILVINTCFSFILNPIFAFLEGLGKVKDIARLRLIQQIVNLVVLWGMLSLGCRLFSAPIAGLSSLIIIFLIFIFSDLRRKLLVVWSFLDKWRVNFRNEIFPYQWKIAVSWISGYFIFQLFNPILFATEGAIVAGQMGMTMTAFNGISGLTMSWITTKVPVFSKYFAQENFYIADNLFKKSFKQVMIITLLGILFFILVISSLQYLGISLGFRFLPTYLVAILGLGLFVNQMVFSWATYLRCHKKEPYLITSVVTAILTLLTAVTFGYTFGVNGLVFGYVIVCAVMKIWEYKIFLSFKNKWHT